MDLCVEGSRDGSSVELQRVRGQCRRFVVTASKAGVSQLRFEARGTVAVLAIEVVPALGP
jgi:hypothetical protein